MGFHCAVGKSKSRDGLFAGRQVASLCNQEMAGCKPDLLILFASPQLSQDQSIAGVLEIFPATPLIGCSSAGEIFGSEADNHSLVMAALSGIKVHLEHGGNIAEESHEAGRILGTKLSSYPAQALLVFSDGLAGNIAAVVRGLHQGLDRTLPLIGGTAGDDFLFQKTFQYFHQKVLSQTVVGAALEGDFTFGVGVRHGWEPVGLPVFVTKALGHRLLELNHHPAVQFYEEYFGEYTHRFRQDSMGRLALLYPLGMSVPDSPEFLLRAPFLLEENGAIQFKAEIPEGAEVCLMIGSVERAISAARIAAMEALAQMQGRVPKLALIFNCVARRKVLGRRAEDEIDTIRDIIGRQVPVIGFYTYGEIAPVEGIKTQPSFFHNETVVILLLG